MGFDFEIGARVKVVSTSASASEASLIADLRRQMREACTIYTPASPPPLVAVKHQLYRTSSGNMETFPRGFYPIMMKVLSEKNISFTAVSKKTLCRVNGYRVNPIDMDSRPHQKPAVDAIITSGEGILVAPPGAGKTVIVLEAIRWSKQRALIIVDKSQLAVQWRERCRQFLDIEPRMYGSEFDTRQNIDSPISIGMVQTLSNDELWDDQYGFVCLDECHHVTADTYMRVFDRYSAHYRIGVSATPLRGDGLEKMAILTIGPVFHTITDSQLEESEFSVKPRANLVKTGFDHVFWSDHSVRQGEECKVPGCKKTRDHSHRNNYAQVTKALTESQGRNLLIAKSIMLNKTNCNLVVSDRLAHLGAIRDLVIEQGFDPARVHMLTGAETAAERATVTRAAGYGECVILSTIAKEGLDITRLDRLYLAWPVKKQHILEQQIGRITRAHPDKKDAVVYDFVDRCSVLAHQARARGNYYYVKKLDIKEFG